MKKSILVYTSTCWAYAETEKEAVGNLKEELKRRNAKNDQYFMLDVSDVEDGTEIDHEGFNVTIGQEVRKAELKKF